MKKIIYTSLALIALASCGQDKNVYDASGVFEATETLVSARGAGEILALSVEEGQELKSGDVVGYLDTTQLHLRKQQLLAGRSGVGYRQQNVSTQVAALTAQLATQRNELARFEKLLAEQAATPKQVDDLRASVRVLERQLSAQQDALSRGNQALGSEEMSIQAQIAQIEDQIEKSKVTVPTSGTILAKYAEVGELASAGRPLFRLANIKDMYLRAYITADQLTQVKIGQSVEVFADAGKSDRKSYKGTISWISDKAEFTPKTIQTRDERANLVYAIKIKVANDGLIKRGMYGEVKL